MLQLLTSTTNPTSLGILLRSGQVAGIFTTHIRLSTSLPPNAAAAAVLSRLLIKRLLDQQLSTNKLHGSAKRHRTRVSQVSTRPKPTSTMTHTPLVAMGVVASKDETYPNEGLIAQRYRDWSRRTNIIDSPGQNNDNINLRLLQYHQNAQELFVSARFLYYHTPTSSYHWWYHTPVSGIFCYAYVVLVLVVHW